MTDGKVSLATDPATADSPERAGWNGRQRVVIERVWPEIDGGRFPIKRTIGEDVTETRAIQVAKLTPVRATGQ